MASLENQHCANCIGTLSFPIKRSRSRQVANLARLIRRLALSPLADCTQHCRVDYPRLASAFSRPARTLCQRRMSKPATTNDQ